MPRVTFVKSARKAQGKCYKCNAAIRVGDSYRWWKFRFGGRYVRCGKPECAPKASDLTRSDFYAQLYSIQDEIEAARGGDKDSFAEALRSAADQLRDLGSECEDKRSNMPDSLQDSDTGQLLQQRAYECEYKASELEQAADELESATDYDSADWETFAEDEGIERTEEESDDEFEQRVVIELERHNEAICEDIDVDISID